MTVTVICVVCSNLWTPTLKMQSIIVTTDDNRQLCKRIKYFVCQVLSTKVPKERNNNSNKDLMN